MNVPGWLRAAYRLRDLSPEQLLSLANRARWDGQHRLADAALDEIRVRGLAS